MHPHMKYFCLIFGLLLLLFACTAPQPLLSSTPSILPESNLPGQNTITGTVFDESGLPLAGATVRIQATANEAFTNAAGRFTLTSLVRGRPVTVSAWADGYYCAKVEQVTPPAAGLTITLRQVQGNDNPAYEWLSPVGEDSCYSCKPAVTQVWLENDAHALSAVNIRFLTMYNGTDVYGNQSPLTRYGYNVDYGEFPLLPDLSQPYYGPGYKLDFPDTDGNCAACHIPGLALAAPYDTDPNMASGVDLFGIHCDYCHKISAVSINPSTDLPYPNMPGVLSQEFRWPFTDDPERFQLFFGSFDDDNVPEEDTFLPLIKESQFCAPCHYGVFWDTLVYNSYGEWLESPYADPQTGQTCQQCHMPSPTFVDGQPLTNIAPGRGGVERDPLTIPAHTFPGAANVEILQNSVTMTVVAERNEDQLKVDVTIFNDQTGHHVPTDSPLRHLILLIQATSPDGTVLTLLEGPTLPDWTGVGDSQAGYYAGLPGKAYAKILIELWT